MSRRRLVLSFSTAALAALVTTVAAASARAEAGGSPKDLAGTWTLNKALSDTPGQPPGGGPQGPGPGGPGGQDEMRPPAGRHGPMGGAESLSIEVKDSTVTVTPTGGDARSLVVGGPPVERRRGPMTVTETVAWKDGALVVTATVPDRPAMTESFGLATDGSGRLVHTVQRPPRGGAEARTMRFTYDRAAAATTMP